MQDSSPPPIPPQIPPLPFPDCNMPASSRNPGTRRVSSADGASIRSTVPREHIRHRPSSYHYGSRQGSQVEKFYNLYDPPSLETISQCISGFIRGTSTLIYILPEYEAIELMNAVYHPGAGRNKATSSELCELLAVAAIGSQYEDIGQEMQFALFRSAKWYLDSGLAREDDVLRKMRISMLVGLFFVFEKSFWARDYLDQAICLARSKGLNATQRHSDYSEREWASWKRVWGSLVFLDGWLSGSLGSIPTICNGDNPVYTDGYRTCTNDLDAYLHTELIKLSVLMGSITKDVYSPAAIDFNTVAAYSARLKTWHSSLPESLRLHRAVSGNDSKQRSTILLAHSSYLSCIILLTRRIFVERLEGPSEDSGSLSRTAIVDEYSRMCVSAGRQLATVVGLLHSEGRIVRRCWMVIQAAFTAGLITLLCISTGENESSNTDPLEDVQGQDLILKCISALEFCAGCDIVAQRFLDILNSTCRLLAISTSQGHQQAGSKRRLDHSVSTDGGTHPAHHYPSASGESIKYILGIFRQPFGGESNVIGQSDYALSKFFPQNWRFLVPEPPPADCLIPDQDTTPVSVSGTPSDEGGSGGRDSKKQRGPPNFRTKEEYEAFFRRIS